ncbi:MAG TPA: tyrosine-protein phosphatase [Myxococcota bacterium]|nr:tyrosine-protein phosphatase [Myxococcales bacterium]HPG27017.1 tyrosine-protein phosphatase [Myxococcota bacterium]
MTDYRAHPEHAFERVANFRDLGGHTTRDGRRVRRGRLLRSGHLGRASEADVEILGRYGLRRVFDFRTPRDIELEGADRLPDGTESVLLPMPDPARGSDIRAMMEGATPEQVEERFGGGRAEQMMRESAAGLVRERREPYALFLKALAESTAVPALFHCSAGKDRAGWAGSVVLLALDVPEEQVVEQYLLSNRAAEQIIAQASRAQSGYMHQAVLPLIGVREEYIHASFEAVREDWGDFDRYLHDGLGITEAEREAIRKNLLE